MEKRNGPETIQDRLDAGDARMSRIEISLSENTAATKRIESKSADLLEFFEAAQGAFRVLEWIGRLAKPIGYVGGAVVAMLGILAALKGGGIGPK